MNPLESFSFLFSEFEEWKSADGNNTKDMMQMIFESIAENDKKIKAKERKNKIKEVLNS